MPCEQHPVRPLGPEDQGAGELAAFAMLGKPWGKYHLTLHAWRTLKTLWGEGKITSGWLVRDLPDEWGLDQFAMVLGSQQCTDVWWLGDEAAAEKTRLRLEDEAEEARRGLAIVLAPKPPTRSIDRDSEALWALWRDFFATAERAEQQGEDGQGEEEADDSVLLEALSTELRAWLKAGYPPRLILPPPETGLSVMESFILTEMMLKLSAPPGVHPDEPED